MQTAQGYMLQSLRTANRFLEQHSERFAGVIATGIHRELLAAIADLEKYIVQQAAGEGRSKIATTTVHVRRRALIENHMRLVTRIARLKRDRWPEMSNLKMPRGNPSAAKLVAAAYEMASSASKNAQVFVDAGLPEDFAGRLKAAADAVMDGRGERTEHSLKRTAATSGLRTKLATGRKIIHALDAMVQVAVAKDDALLIGWRQASRVEKVPGPSARSTTAAQQFPTGDGGHRAIAGAEASVASD